MGVVHDPHAISAMVVYTDLCTPSATRFDRKAAYYLAFLQLAAAVTWSA